MTLQDTEERKKGIVITTVEEAVEWAVETNADKGMHVVSKK